MSVVIAYHEEQSIVLPDGNVALLQDCLAVKPHYRLAPMIILPHPFLVRSWFAFLCLAACSLSDAAKLIFTIGHHNGNLLPYSHVLTSHPGFTFHCDTSPVHLSFGQLGRNTKFLLVDQKWRMAEQKWLCSDKLSAHFLYLISSSAILWHWRGITAYYPIFLVDVCTKGK